MAQCGEPPQTLALWRAASGHGHEVVVLHLVERLYPTARSYLYTVAPRQCQQAVDDGMRVLCLRKHTLVVLSDQRHPMLFKPVVGILMVEGMEQSFQQAVPSRIHLLQVVHQAKRVGTVATAPTRQFHLGQHMLAALEDGNPHLRHPLLQVDGQKESCRPAAYDGCPHRLVHDVTMFLQNYNKRT